MMRNKKASLNLSINAIVILILAITMLGLGLTFMRGVFKQATSKVEAAVSASDLTNPPTIENPLTLYPSTLTVRSNDKAKILLAFMHAEGADRDCILTIYDSTGNPVDPGETTPVSPATKAYNYFMTYRDTEVTTIPPDKIFTWAITIDPDDSTAAVGTGSSIYTTEITCEDSSNVITGTYKKDILIKITS